MSSNEGVVAVDHVQLFAWRHKCEFVLRLLSIIRPWLKISRNWPAQKCQSFPLYRLPGWVLASSSEQEWRRGGGQDTGWLHSLWAQDRSLASEEPDRQGWQKAQVSVLLHTDHSSPNIYTKNKIPKISEHHLKPIPHTLSCPSTFNMRSLFTRAGARSISTLPRTLPSNMTV